MNAAIVDTDVVSMLFKGDTRALACRPQITGRLLVTGGQRRKLGLAQHLTRYTVLPVSRELCGRCAEVSFAAKTTGRPIQTARAGLLRVPSTIKFPSSPTIATTIR